MTTLDEAHRYQLEHILNKALAHVEKCIENDSPHMGSEWMCIATNADHILRKHETQHDTYIK